ncbi:hypothetical protein, partial [Candidatus Poriferisodalis sp.]|uniref:hypothetical protein n=1 Tax=Candidatus Poriferisodalis sp. TaxID=3101277 RepID=UPI003B524D58
GDPEEVTGRPDPNAPATSLYRYNVTVADLAKGDVIEVARNTFLDTGNRGQQADEAHDRRRGEA